MLANTATHVPGRAVLPSSGRFQPRPYQAEAIEAGLRHMTKSKKRAGIIVAPPGAGKSLIIAKIAEQLPGKTLVFQPSIEILKQNVAKMVAFGLGPEVFSASAGSKRRGRLTVATIGTAARRPELFHDVQNVIIDECHYVNAMEGMYRDFLMSIGDCRILGLTATPFRLATNSFGSELRFLTRTRPRVFEDVVHVTQIGSLFDDGYLCPLEYKSEVAIDEERLKLNSTGADYTDESVRKHLREIDFGERLALNVQAQLDDGRRSIVVFTRFVEESAALAKALGNSAAMVHSGSSPAEREDILGRFKSGQLRVVTNVGIIATGFDFPALDTVVLARPTMSLAVYYQQVGRVVRTDATKTSARVVDLVGISRGFGRIENLELRNDGGPKWAFYSGKRRLTNKTFTKLSMMHG